MPVEPSAVQQRINRDAAGWPVRRPSSGVNTDQRERRRANPSVPLGAVQSNAPARSNGDLSDSEVRGMSLEQRLIKAMELAVNSGKLSKEMQQSLRQLLTPDNLKILAGIISLWGVGHLFGYGQAADAVLAGLGVLGLGFESAKAAQALWGFLSEAQNAQSFAGLQKSSDHFAEFVSVVGTNALFAFIGKNAGKAVEGLSGVVAKAGNRLNEMTPAVRKLAKEALEAGSNLLANAGTSINSSLRKLRNVWDNLWGGGRQLQTAPAGGGKPPSSNNQIRGGSSASGNSNTSEQAYNALRTRIHLTAETANRLRAKGIDVNTVEVLNKRGLAPDKLNQLLDDIRLNPTQKYKLEFMAKIADTMVGLINKGMSIENVQKLIKLAAQHPQVLNEVMRIANSKGELVNPDALIGLVDGAIKNLETSKVGPGNRLTDRGILLEIRIAAERLEQRHKVQLGTVTDKSPPHTKRGGDIVDHSTKETLQVKHVVSPTEDAVLNNMQKALKQLQGEYGEYPTPGYTQVAEIRIEGNNQFFGKSGSYINGKIQEMVNKGGLDKFDGFVRIVKVDGAGKPLEAVRFRIKNGISQPAPEPPAVYQRSSLVPGTSTANVIQQSAFIDLLARQQNPDLYAALNVMQQLNDKLQGDQQNMVYSSAVETLVAPDKNLVPEVKIAKTNNRGIELG
jgi:hypothetical protein